MVFYFTTVGKAEYLLEIDEGSDLSNVLYALQSEITMEGQTDFLPGDELDIEGAINRLVKKGLIKKNHYVRIAKITGKRISVRDAEVEDEDKEPEYCYY